MKKTSAVLLAILGAVALMAQGPGGPGRMGRGPGGGFGGPGGGFGGGGLGGWAGPGGRKLVTGQPFSGTQTVTTQQTIGGGNQITRTQQSTVARDSQGRVSTSETVPPPAAFGKAPFTVTSIFDPVAGFRYRLDSSTMLAMQAALPPQRPQGTNPNRGNRPANPNVTTTSLGTLTVNGVLATGTQVTQTIPAGAIGNAQPIQIVRVEWIANALQVPVQIKSSDPRFGTTDMELTGISQAEPNGSLFTVPAGYTVQQQPGGPGPNARKGGGPAGPAGRMRRPDGPPPAQF